MTIQHQTCPDKKINPVTIFCKGSELQQQQWNSLNAADQVSFVSRSLAAPLEITTTLHYNTTLHCTIITPPSAPVNDANYSNSICLLYSPSQSEPVVPIVDSCYTTLHYCSVTLHYTTLHYTTLQGTAYQ